jgi:hypothetical protein
MHSLRPKLMCFSGFLTTTLFVVTASHASLAFTITPTQPGATSIYDGTASFLDTTRNPDRNYVTTLIPLATAVRGGAPRFLEDLRSEFGAKGWVFTPVTNISLPITLQVRNYFACAGSDTPKGSAQSGCGISAGSGSPSVQRLTNGIGSLVDISYIRGNSQIDPSRLHWIQRVIIDRPNDVVRKSFIDINREEINLGRSPYYDDGFAAVGGVYFLDRPYVPIPEDGAFRYKFQLHIAEETSAKRVKIYNGIQWGYTATVSTTDEPPPPPPPPPGGSGGRGYATDVLGVPKLSSQDLKFAPEPSLSILGLMVLGVMGVVRGLRSKLTK